jgi:dipeptidyl aminopeptidase/acylaminoacyl peptidase
VIWAAIAIALVLHPIFLESAEDQQTKELRPLLAEDALSLVSFANGPLTLAADGNWLAYVVQDARRRQTFGASSGGEISEGGVPASALGTDICLTDLRSGISRSLTNGKDNNWAPSWAPDGKRIAFYSDRSGSPNLWLYDAGTGESRQVSSVIVRPSSNDVPKWADNGTKILTKILPEGESLRQAFALLMPSPNEVSRLTKHPDSTATVYRADTPRAQTGTHPSASGITQNVFTRSNRADLAFVDVQTGTTEIVARGFNPSWYELSADGSVLALAHAKGQLGADNYRNLHDLVLIGVGRNKTTRTVASNIQSTLDTLLASFSPDGRWVSYISLPTDGPADCVLVNVLDGSSREAAKDPHPDFTNQYRAPRWDAKSRTLYFVVNSREIWKVPLERNTAEQVATLQTRTITAVVPSITNGSDEYWSPDQGQSMLVQGISYSGRGEFLKVNLGTGSVTLLNTGERALGGNWSLAVGSLDGTRVIFASEDAMHPVDLWSSDRELQHVKRISQLNPQLGNYVFGRSRILEWLSTDGELLRGALLLPAGYQQDRKYPLVVFVYPGNSGSETAYRFGLFGFAPYYNMQLLATRGYAVLYPDCPVHPGTIMQDVANAVLPGINRVIEIGIADPKRVGVMGASLGGYGALSLIVQSQRFKAAIMHSGLGNLTSGYGEMSEDGSAYLVGVLEENRRTQLGTPWTARERYIENSPVFYLDRVETPLLIMHGSKDFAVEPFLSEEIFVDLRRLGKPVVYVKYEGEGHGIERYHNQIDFVERVIDWFDKYLRKD